MTLGKKPFKNIVGKGENAGNQHFLLFPQCVLPISIQISSFSVTFILLSVSSFNLDQSKNLSFDKGLNQYDTSLYPQPLENLFKLSTLSLVQALYGL